MKKFFIGIFCCVLIFILGGIVSFQHRTTYVLPPKISLALFGTNPEDFFKIDRDFYSDCEDFRKHAKIDENGNLVLKLTKSQENALLKAEDSNIEKTKKNPGIIILDDYSEIIVTGDREQIADILWNEFDILTITDMANRQLFSGKNPSEISIKVTVIESISNEILYTANWPSEPINFSFIDGIYKN